MKEYVFYSIVHNKINLVTWSALNDNFGCLGVCNESHYDGAFMNTDQFLDEFDKLMNNKEFLFLGEV